jgi:hypothetical protein
MTSLHHVGSPMDWDELLFEIPIVGLDFELLIPVDGLKLFRGPMGSILREGDKVVFRPEWVVIKRELVVPKVIDEGDGLNSPSVHLMRSRLRRLNDESILILAEKEPWFLIHAPGENVNLAEVFGRGARA